MANILFLDGDVEPEMKEGTLVDTWMRYWKERNVSPVLISGVREII